jgi:hypothetical protein
MVDNENTGCLDARGVSDTFASMLIWPNDFGHFNRAL